MFKIRKQIKSLYAISAFSSFQIAGASWVALLAVRGFSMVQIGFAECLFHVASLLFEIPSGVISDVFGRKKTMIASQCFFVFSAFLMVISKSVAGVYVAIMLDALGYNFASGTREALAYDSLKKAGKETEYNKYASTEMMIYRIGNASAMLCAGLGGAAGAKLVQYCSHWRYSRISILCISGVLAGSLSVLTKCPIIMCIGGFLAGLFDDFLQVRSDVLLNGMIPSSQRATLVSVSSLCFSIIMIVLSPLVGWIFSFL